MTSRLQGKGTLKKAIPPPIILENKDVKEMLYLSPPHPGSFSWEKKHHFVSINGESVESMAGTQV